MEEERGVREKVESLHFGEQGASHNNKGGSHILIMGASDEPSRHHAIQLLICVLNFLYVSLFFLTLLHVPDEEEASKVACNSIFKCDNVF